MCDGKGKGSGKDKARAVNREVINDENLMKAINCWVIPVAGYIVKVYTLGKEDLQDLNMIVKSVLRREGFHGRQSNDERLYANRK